MQFEPPRLYGDLWKKQKIKTLKDMHIQCVTASHGILFSKIFNIPIKASSRNKFLQLAENCNVKNIKFNRMDP